MPPAGIWLLKPLGGGRQESRARSSGPVPHLQERLREGEALREAEGMVPGQPGSRDPRGAPRPPVTATPTLPHCKAWEPAPHHALCTTHTHAHMHTHTPHHTTQTHACTCAHRRTTHRPQSPGRRGLEPCHRHHTAGRSSGLSDDTPDPPAKPGTGHLCSLGGVRPTREQHVWAPPTTEMGRPLRHSSKDFWPATPAQHGGSDGRWLMP